MRGGFGVRVASYREGHSALVLEGTALWIMGVGGLW